MYNNGKTEFFEAEGMGGSVELWVREQDISSTKGHMVFGTAGDGGLLQVKIDKQDDSFVTASDGGTPSHHRWRWRYDDSNAKLLKVRLSISGTTTEVPTGVDKKIILIQIKTEKAAPPSPRSPQKKP